MSTNETFAIVGLTGGIASGKSTVSDMFRDHGVRVLDADVIAREIVEPGEPALDEIRGTFGDEVIGPDGHLDRDALGDVVFDDDEARRRLEAITHPRIARRMRRKADRVRDAGESWVVYDAALIVENDLVDAFDCLIVVWASESTRLERLMRRDDLEAEQARARLDAQMPLESKLEVADYIVDNDGDLDATRRRVDELYEFLDSTFRRYGTAAPDRLADHGLDIQPPCRADELSSIDGHST